MLAVVLVALGPHGVDAETAALAPELGITRYEAGLLVRGALPVLVKRVPDVAGAQALLAGLRARGNEAVAFDEDAVAREDTAVAVKHFRFDDTTLFVSDGDERAMRAVPFADIVAIVRAVASRTTTTTTVERSSKLSVGRAMLSGGLLVTKNVTTERKTQEESRDLVASVFTRDGRTFVLAARALHYEGLGALQPSQVENFGTLVQVLRGRAPNAVYDERLLQTRPGADVALLAHALAIAATAR